MMVIDMTQQLAPLFWVMLALLAVPAAGIALAAVLEPRVVWRSGAAGGVRTGRKVVPLRHPSPSRA